MRTDIVNFVKQMCAKYKLSAFYHPYTDAYIIHHKGKIVAAWTNDNYYDLPKAYRIMNIQGGMHGLESNMGEKYYAQCMTDYQRGKTIVKNF